MANQLLKIKEGLKDRSRHRSSRPQLLQHADASSRYNMQSQQAAAQAAKQKIQTETKSKMKIKQAEIAFEIEKKKNEAMLKQQLMQVEFNLQMQLKGAEIEGLKSRETQREEAKAGRISQMNTQQSKMIQQKKNDLPPIDFESNEDSLDGFDFAEFNPR